jgi:hypothetical protein
MALTGQKTLACDPNDALPGALPPAPNGGELGEVKRLDKKTDPTGEKAKSDEPRLYWEGVYLRDQKQISLSLVAAMPPKTAIFTVLSPQQEFSDLHVKVENVRERKIISVPFSVMKDRILVNFDGKDLNRFIVHIEGNKPDGARKALVQIEEE